MTPVLVALVWISFGILIAFVGCGVCYLRGREDGERERERKIRRAWDRLEADRVARRIMDARRN